MVIGSHYDLAKNKLMTMNGIQYISQRNKTKKNRKHTKRVDGKSNERSRIYNRKQQHNATFNFDDKQ